MLFERKINIKNDFSFNDYLSLLVDGKKYEGKIIGLRGLVVNAEIRNK